MRSAVTISQVPRLLIRMRKVDGSTAAININEDRSVLEAVALARRCRLEESVLPLDTNTLKLLQCNVLDQAGVTALDEVGTPRMLAHML